MLDQIYMPLANERLRRQQLAREASDAEPLTETVNLRRR